MSLPASGALRLPAGPGLARVLPFAAFVGLMALEPWSARVLDGAMDTRWLYALRTAVAAGLLAWCWPALEELTGPVRLGWRQGALALATGLGVLALWIGLDAPYLVLGGAGSGFVPVAADGELEWPLVLMRLAGSALLVPVIEELFWRSFLMRWLERQDWPAVVPGEVGARAVLLSSVVFGFEHVQWAAGIAAGLAYAWLYARTGSLWTAIAAHAVTNAGLGVWVVAWGAWHFW